MLNEYNFKSIFKDELNKFIIFKKSLGYKYKDEIRRIKRIDEYLKDINLKRKTITKEVYEELTKRNGMADGNYSRKRTVITHFCIFLNNLGFKNIYYSNIKIRVRNNYIPTLFSKEKIDALFKTLNSYVGSQIESRYHNLYYTYSVMIRLLYACGIRVSEAINLEISDIDFNKNTIKIKDSKNHVSREIPFSESIKSCLINLINKVNHSQKMLFVNSRYHKIVLNDFEKFYKRILGLAKLNTNAHLHDLRHVYTNMALSQVLDMGYDEGVALVYLFKYLGHKSIKETEYYIHFTDYNKNKVLNYSEKLSNILYKESDVSNE